MKSEYIVAANKVYDNLKKVDELFEKQAYVISYAKCVLLRQEELNDFYINGINVSVYQTNNGYELCFDSNIIDIEIYDSQIINFEVRR